jgi:hypothetical protein
MYNKRVKVIGGIREQSSDDEKKKGGAIFLEKKVVVVEERNLAALFRRDDYLRSLSIRIEDTTAPLTPGLFFSDFPIF